MSARATMAAASTPPSGVGGMSLNHLVGAGGVPLLLIVSAVFVDSPFNLPARLRELAPEVIVAQTGGVVTRTAVWRWVGDYFVEVFGSETVSAEDWTSLVAELSARKASLKGVLVLTGGAAPNARQRTELANTLSGTSFPAAVLTDSTMARVALSALALFFKDRARPFSTIQLPEALDYLKVPAHLRTQMTTTVKALQSELWG